jgi:hypothetical protein
MSGKGGSDAPGLVADDRGRARAQLHVVYLAHYLAHCDLIRPHLTPPDPTADAGEVLGNNRLVQQLLDVRETT